MARLKQPFKSTQVPIAGHVKATEAGSLRQACLEPGQGMLSLEPFGSRREGVRRHAASHTPSGVLQPPQSLQSHVGGTHRAAGPARLGDTAHRGWLVGGRAPPQQGVQ